MAADVGITERQALCPGKIPKAKRDPVENSCLRSDFRGEKY